MNRVIRAVLTALLFTVQGFGQGTSKPPLKKGANEPPTKKEVYMFATTRLVSKGGIGIINEDLFIVAKSAKNELVLKDGRNWTGQAAEKRELVIVFQDRVLSPVNLPKDFDLSKAVVVSFEGDIIRFFEFDDMEGGYYSRLKPD
jgi:hypothetical protein